MKIAIENIALIKKAEIELNGITVIAGLNKTGKTTIGRALYAMIRAYGNLPQKVLMSKKDGIRKAFVNIIRQNKEIFEKTSLWVFELAEDFIAPIKERDLLEWMVDDAHEKLREYIDQWVHSKKEFEDYISGEELDAMYKAICVVLERKNADYEKYLIESFVKRVFNKQINCFYNDGTGIMRLEISDNVMEVEFSGNELTHFTPNINFDTSAIYIESISLIDLIQSDQMNRGTRFSQQTNVCLKLLKRSSDKDDVTYEEYAEAKKTDEIIKYIIQKVTHGSLKNDSSGIFFNDQKCGKPVELSNLSAGLKVFVVIQTLLENGSLKSGDILLIDEPEVNLHPEWQIVLAELLVLLQKELGIIIYINSHSPYFIRAIEINMARNEMTLRGKFYLTKLDDNNLYRVEDVSQNTERIYELLYKPLENL